MTPAGSPRSGSRGRSGDHGDGGARARWPPRRRPGSAPRRPRRRAWTASPSRSPRTARQNASSCRSYASSYGPNAVDMLPIPLFHTPVRHVALALPSVPRTLTTNVHGSADSSSTPSAGEEQAGRARRIVERHPALVLAPQRRPAGLGHARLHRRGQAEQPVREVGVVGHHEPHHAVVALGHVLLVGDREDDREQPDLPERAAAGPARTMRVELRDVGVVVARHADRSRRRPAAATSACELGRAGGDRLLDQDVLAGAQRRAVASSTWVAVGVSTKTPSTVVVGEQLLGIRVGPRRPPPGRAASTVRVGVEHARELGAPRPLDGQRVHLGHHAAAEERDPHGRVRQRGGRRRRGARRR